MNNNSIIIPLKPFTRQLVNNGIEQIVVLLEFSACVLYMNVSSCVVNIAILNYFSEYSNYQTIL